MVSLQGFQRWYRLLKEAKGISKIIIAVGYTDLRYGINRLALLIKEKYRLDPFEKNVLFIFCGKRTDQLKAILQEGDAVDAYLGTGGDHQDDFLRGDHPKDLLQNSIVTLSLDATIINGKYVDELKATKDIGLSIGTKGLSDSYILYKKNTER